jgi:hypothetical protein
VKNDKHSRLTKVGFENAKEISFLQKKWETKLKGSLVKMYREMFPLHKFIFREQAMLIAKKYNLVLAPIQRFKGFVPEKNLAQIENFLKNNMPSQHLQIVAPAKWIKLGPREHIQSNRIAIQDPIVLFPVRKDGYIIITAWGNEASDPMIVNEQMQ